jgi:hypothetical protein
MGFSTLRADHNLPFAVRRIVIRREPDCVKSPNSSMLRADHNPPFVVRRIVI